jgi:hypothetical protein
MYCVLLGGGGISTPPPPTKGNPVAYAHPSSHHQEMDHSFLPSSGYAPVNRLTRRYMGVPYGGGRRKGGVLL